VYVRKKITPAIGTGKDPEPIDFSWVYVIGMRMGLSFSEVKHMYFGFWHDMFEAWKEQYNFETKKMIYKTMDDYKVASLDEL